MTGLILLHGFAGDATSWDEVRSLLDPVRPTLVPTLLGHGDDARDQRAKRAATFEDEVDRLASVIEARGFADAHLCGYSLGARVALGLLVRHPDLFLHATLIGVNAGIEHHEDRVERERSDRAWIEMLERDGIERFAQAWEAQALFSSQSDRLKEKERARRIEKDPFELARSLAVLGLASMPNYWPLLGELPMTVHLIAGARDRTFCIIGERMHARLARGELTIVPDCGHNVPLERPAAIAEVLIR